MYNGTKVFDESWHHIAFTWTRSSQEINTYIDGIEENPIGTGEYGHRALKEKLRFALGQDQDHYESGAYDGKQSFVGNITAFNTWDRAFPYGEIFNLARECPSNRQGNLMNWTDIAKQRSDALNLVSQGKETKLSCFDYD